MQLGHDSVNWKSANIHVCVCAQRGLCCGKMSVCSSVCDKPSVTRRYCVETAKHILKRFHCLTMHTILEFFRTKRLNLMYNLTTLFTYLPVCFASVTWRRRNVAKQRCQLQLNGGQRMFKNTLYCLSNAVDMTNRPSHAGIVSKRLNISSNFFHCLVTMHTILEFFRTKPYSNNPTTLFTYYGRPLSVSGRPCYILPMFFLFFFMAALFSGPG